MNIKEAVISIFRKKTIHHTVYVTAGSLVNGFSLLALNILLARSLSKDAFGLFSLSVLVLLTMGEISDLGLNSGLLRFGPYYISTGQEEKLKQLVKTIWKWRVSLSALLTIGGIIFAYPLARFVFGQAALTPYITFTSFGVGGVILLGFLATYLQAEQRFLRQAVVQSLKGVLRLVIVLVLLFFGQKNLFFFLAVYLFVPWVLFFLNYSVLPRGFRKAAVDEEVRQKMHAQLAKFSFWLTVWSVVAIIAGKVDQAMVSHFLGLEQVAVFTVAWQLIQFFPVITGSISSVLMPKVSGMTDVAELKSFILKTFKWVLSVALIIGIIIYPSQFLIIVLFGSKYAQAMPLFLILSYSMLFNIIIIPFSLAVTAFNRTQIVALSGFIQMFVMVVCNFIFIPKFGIIGSAYTYMLGTAFQFIWSIAWAWYFVAKKQISVV